MAYRTCETCRKAENPLGKLKFKKHLDGKVYCENCLPFSAEVLSPVAERQASPSPLPGTSAGSLVVIPCPDCLGQGRSKRHPQSVIEKCSACAGWGRVRIPENFLNVYRPKGAKPVAKPEILNEG